MSKFKEKIKKGLKGLPMSMLIIMGIFGLGCVILVASGANGTWESMNFFGYLGMILCLVGILAYPLSELGYWIVSLFKKKK